MSAKVPPFRVPANGKHKLISTAIDEKKEIKREMCNFSSGLWPPGTMSRRARFSPGVTEMHLIPFS